MFCFSKGRGIGASVGGLSRIMTTLYLEISCPGVDQWKGVCVVMRLTKHAARLQGRKN